MNKEKYNELLKKYLAAKSTLEEEEALFNTTEQNSGIKAWATFIKQKREQAPPQLKYSIFKTIKNRERRKRRFLLGLSGIAAAIIFFISMFSYYTISKNAEYREKEVLLNEVLSMFPDEKSTPVAQDIVYEDEMVIIYLSSE